MDYKYFTPDSIANIMMELIDVKSPQNIIDISAGDGSLLIAARKKWSSAICLGIDVKWDKYVKEMLENKEKIHCIQANSLELNKPVDNDPIIKNKYNIVLANPPFDAKKKIEINLENIQSLGMQLDDVPNKLFIEEIFTLINLSILDDKGYIGIILPSSIISNNSGIWLRKCIINALTVNYIIELPRSIFKDVDTVTYLLIAKKTNPNNNNVLMGEIDKNHKLSWKVKVSQNYLEKRMDPSFHISTPYPNDSITRSNTKILRELLKNDVRRGYAIYGTNRGLTQKSATAIPLWHTTNIKNGLLIPNSNSYILPSSPAFKEYALTQKGDILMARVGRGCVGNLALVWSKKDIGIASDCIYIIRPISLEISIMVFAYLNCKNMKEYIKGISKGSGSLTLGLNDLHELKVLGFDYIESYIGHNLNNNREIPWSVIKKLTLLFENEMNMGNMNNFNLGVV